MKKLALFGVILLTSLGLWAQDNSNTILIEPITIEFESIVFDFGQIDYGSEGVCSFTFSNKGTEPLIINTVRASCGCTTPDWTKDPIKPGAKGEVKVKYNTRLQGAFSKSVVVTSSGTPQSVYLRVTGVVKPPNVEQLAQ
ncbi:MAG: DUF1573 domain-containing protein [Bacteroidales bacterium]